LYYERYFSTGEPHKIFVFDFGGGTLDVSVLNFNDSQTAGEALTIDKLSKTVLGSHGVDLGGTDFDKDIFEDMFLKYFGSNVTYGKKELPMPAHFYHNITEWHLQEHREKNRTFEFLRSIANDSNCSDREAVSRLITLVEDQQVYSILRKIEFVKTQLSANGTRQIRHNHRNIHIDELLSRKRFEAIVRSRIALIQECVDDCLKKAQISPQEIDVVLKVGGSSNNFFVDEMLRRIFPGHIRGTDVFTSVVSGLAVAAESLSD